MKASFKVITSLLALFFAFTFSAYGQTGNLHAHSVGMGGTGTTYISGFSSNFINPANLMLSDRDTQISFGIANVGFGAGGPLLDIHTYNNYLTDGGTLTLDRQRQMLDDWVGDFENPGNIHYADFGIAVVPFGISMKRGDQAFSLAFGYRNEGRMGLSRGVLEAGFGGLNDEIFGEARALNTYVGSQSYGEISFGYARQVLEMDADPVFGLPMRMYAGAAPKILLGMQRASLSFNSDLQVRGDSVITHNFSYKIEAAGSLARDLDRFRQDRESGMEGLVLADYIDDPSSDFASFSSMGFGLDLGATFEFDLPEGFIPESFAGSGRQIFRASVSLTDFGYLSYGDDSAVFEHSDQLVWEGLEIDNVWIRQEFDDNFDDYFSYVMEDSIGTSKYLGFERTGDGPVTANLPTRLNLGFELRAGNATAVMDFRKGFNNYGLNSQTIAVGTGLEYRFWGVWPIRAGLNTGGNYNTSYTIGTGVHTRGFEFNTGLKFVRNSQNGGTVLNFGVGALTFHF